MVKRFAIVALAALSLAACGSDTKYVDRVVERTVVRPASDTPECPQTLIDAAVTEFLRTTPQAYEIMLNGLQVMGRERTEQEFLGGFMRSSSDLDEECGRKMFDELITRLGLDYP